MSHATVKCDGCGVNVVFDSDPYRNPSATKYWKSTYTTPEKSLFVMQRKIPSQSNKGKITTQLQNEHVLEIYCGPTCGLGRY